ncbi:MAG: Glu-tRNA(Gln) amidotransferase subunit GatD [Candidatus Thalassarchaeaceae archaeon]|nr:Glu-tRNA(Gln) amidotransferase subunit GatD [Candidatus Thalassarchaeaceae archaeon]
MVEADDVPDVGSRVRLVATTWNGPTEVEGVLLSPNSEGHVTVKLVNGYNATHSLASIEQIEVLGSISVGGDEVTSVEVNSNLPLVHILHTGGTIASKVDYATGAVTARFEPEEIIASVPELLSVARIETRKLGNMWSDDIRSLHWNQMAEAAAASFDDGAEGVVITHGTDTMHISAAALAFAFSGGGGVPAGRIAFTGSQRSSDRGSTDGAENLIAAVHWAASGPKPSGASDSTVVVMHATSDDGTMAVIPGCAARKNHSSRRDAFTSINQPNIATISVTRGEATLNLEDAYNAASTSQERTVENSPVLYDSNIKILQLVSGSHLYADQIKHASAHGYSAILFWGTGLGHLPLDNPGNAPENDEVRSSLIDYLEGGGVVAMSTQCILGPVHLDVYSKGRDQQEIGVLGHGTNFPPETALVKLHHLLSRGLSGDELASAWRENLVGENPSDI